MVVPKGKKNKHIILVEVEGEPTLRLPRLKKEHPERPVDYWEFWVDKTITDQTACVFDTRTKVYTDNAVYESVKGLYIKKQGKRFYLEDFE